MVIARRCRAYPCPPLSIGLTARWARREESMNRLIITTFTASLTAFAFSVSAETADDTQDTTTPQLPGLVITATRSEQPENRLPAAVTVITHQEIEDSGAQHVVDV